MALGWLGRGSGGGTHTDSGMIAGMRAYWEALRDGEMLPRRDRVDPRGIAGALEHAFLIERIAPGIARFRIAGMAYSDLMGMDVRAMPVSCLFLAETRMRLQMDLERVFRGPSIVTLDLLAERALGRGPLTARMQILPLLGARTSDGREGSDLAIGCIELTGEAGRSPRRFAITGGTVEALPPTVLPARDMAARDVPARDMADARPARAMGLAEASAPLLAPRPPRPAPGTSHLRLVKN